MNLMSVDAQRFMDMMPYVQVVWSGPYQIIVSLIFLYVIMGPSIFAGFAIMLVMLPLSAVLASFARKLQARMMTNKDSRIKIVSEVLNGIKVILGVCIWCHCFRILNYFWKFSLGDQALCVGVVLQEADRKHSTEGAAIFEEAGNFECYDFIPVAVCSIYSMFLFVPEYVHWFRDTALRYT